MIIPLMFCRVCCTPLTPERHGNLCVNCYKEGDRKRARQYWDSHRAVKDLQPLDRVDNMVKVQYLIGVKGNQHGRDRYVKTVEWMPQSKLVLLQGDQP